MKKPLLMFTAMPEDIIEGRKKIRLTEEDVCEICFLEELHSLGEVDSWELLTSSEEIIKLYRS